jgi:hypothetical protein
MFKLFRVILPLFLALFRVIFPLVWRFSRIILPFSLGAALPGTGSKTNIGPFPLFGS